MADTQINVGMNVDGVTTGTEKVKRSLKDLGTSARESGKSIEGMGDGGKNAADKVESATRSMIGSIQRQTAALEAGDRSSRKYQESLAKMRGVDTSALKPYLDQLDQAKAKQIAATASQESMAAGFTAIRVGALAAAAAIGAFGAAFKNIVNGIDALNDLKDATGASIENISALEDVALRTGASFDTVSTSLIKLNQGLNSAKPGSDTENAIKAIGLSVKDLKALDPAEAFRQIAVGLSGFSDDANKARLTQELFGKSLKEVAPLLKDVAEQGKLNSTVTTEQAEAAETLNKHYSSLQKNVTDLARSIAGELIPSLNSLAVEMAAAKKTSIGFWDGFLTQGLQNPFKSAAENAAKYRDELTSLEAARQRFIKGGNDTTSIDTAIATMKRRLEYVKEVQLQLTQFSKDDQSSAENARLGLRKNSIGDLPDQAAIKAGASAAAKALADLNKELSAQAKLIAENAGLTGSFTEDWDRLAAIYKKGGYNLEQLTEAQANLLAKQPAIKAFNDAEVKAAEAIEKANKAAFESRLKTIDALGSGLEKLQEEVTKQQEYIERLGLTKDAIAELDAVKLELQATDLESIAIKKLDRDLDEEQYDLYKKQAAALRNLANLKRTGGEKEAAIETAKAAAAEWQKGWEETDRLARDVFTSWATDGGNAAQKIGDTLKKALLSAIYEATLKPIAFQLYTSIAGGGAGNVVNAAGSASSWLGGLTGPSSYAGQFASGFSGSASSASALMGGAELTTAAKIGSAVGTVAPYVAAALVVKELMSYKIDAKGNALTATVGSTGVTNGQVGTRADFTQTGGLFGGGTTQNSSWGVADKGVSDYITGSVTAITAANKAYGDSLGLTSDAITGFTKNLDITITGLDAAGQKAAIDKELATFSAEQITATYGTALASVAKTGETTGDTLARLSTDISGVNSAFGALGYTLYDVSVAGAAAASGLASAFGSLQNFQAQTASLYQNYYTGAEQKSVAVNNAASSLHAAGITGFSTADISNATREQVRAVVDQYAAKIGTTEGDKQYAAVVAAANSLNSFVPAFQTTAKEVVQQAANAGSSGGGGGYEAASSVVSAWQDAADAIIETMTDIRLSSLETGADSFAKLKAQFAIEIAQAGAGDLSAMQDLPALAKSLEESNKTNAKSAVEQALFTSYILDSLGRVSGAGNAGGALTAPNYTGAPIQAATGPQIYTPAYVPQTTTQSTNTNMEVVFTKMEQRLAAIELSNEKLRRLLFDVTDGGKAMQTEAYV